MFFDNKTKYDLEFYNLRDYGYESIIQNDTKYCYSSLIKHCDLLIDIPKYKTHVLTYFTGAIKNMYGCIIKSQRKELHKDVQSDQFAKHIYSIYSIRIPDLVITDAIYCYFLLTYIFILFSYFFYVIL